MAPVGVRFGKRLRSLREAREWTATYMAEASGRDVKFYRALESGDKEPCLGTLERLAKALGITLSELLRDV